MTDITEVVNNINTGFHRSIALIHSIAFSDCMYDVKIYGFGFMNAELPISKLDWPLNDRSVCLFGYDVNFKATSYHVLKNAKAYEDLKSRCRPKEVLFHINPCVSDVHRVQVSMSSRVFCNLAVISDETRSLNLQDCVRITSMRTDEHRTNTNQSFASENQSKTSQTFRLCSQLASKQLETLSEKIAFSRPKVLFGLESCGKTCAMRVTSGDAQTLGSNMQVMRCVFAIHCPQWPSNAQEWVKRNSMKSCTGISATAKWPNLDLVHKIMREGVYLIPYESSKCNTGFRQSENSDHDNTFWEYSFVQAEKELISSLIEAGNGKLYHCILLLTDLICQKTRIQREVLLKILTYSLFWFLENESQSSESCNDDIRRLLCYILKQIECQYIKHYFISSMNMFAGLLNSGDLVELLRVTNDVCENYDHMAEKISYHTISSLLFNKVLLHNNNITSDQHEDTLLLKIMKKIQDNFKKCFNNSLKLAHLHLFSKLNSNLDLRQALECHMNNMKNLKTMPISHYGHTGEKIRDWLVSLTMDTLGSLYIAKAQESQITTPTTNSSYIYFIMKKAPSKSFQPTHETYYLVNKAEELLLAASRVDLLSGRVRLANFYYITQQFQECFEITKDILYLTGSVENGSATSVVTTVDELKGYQSSHFIEKFLEDLSNRNVILDLLFSDLDRRTLPLFLSKYLDYTKSTFSCIHQSHGNSVYLIDAYVYCRLLYAMSQYRLGQTEQSVLELNKLEHLWRKTESDLNTRRNMAYLNTIALCYLEIGEKRQAIRVFQDSLDEFANVEMRMKLFILKNEKAKQVVQTTVGVVLGVVVAATVYGVVKNQLS